MSITAAFNNALSGLRAAGRASDVIAMNVANATTEGYARREIELSSTSANLVGGVTVNGIARITNPAIVAARREAESDFGYSNSINAFVSRLENTVGTPDNPAGLTNLIAEFEADLLTAASRPDSVERLDTAIAGAGDLVQVFRDTSAGISQMRSDADSQIASMVDRLNSALEEVESLNTEIAKFNISGLDDSALLDMRQQVVDEINEMVPAREAVRDDGKIALYSTGGVILIDGSARTVEFSKTNQVTPYMSLAGGTLSGLSIDGIPVNTTTSNGGFPGGTIAAQFAIRDELGPDAMAQIDAAARDLVERFQDPAVDPTLLLGDAGLFTDAGSAFDPTDEVGLAERLQLNAAVDPAQGGEVWRLRDGINAVAPGPVGQSALLDSLRDALTLRRTPASGDFGTGALTAGDVADGMMSRIGVQRLQADQSLTFASAALNEMAQAERASGVDSDAELQRLIVIEQAYAANARVFQTIENMMDVLTRLGE